ncbi:cytochrome c [Chitinophaga horti]|uniref:Cytochrome c n=1 Tax=Chitinophaga horti TaxID=2920382 RepID=A0ABY6J7R1_9BACT|nr:cytochrome c [Chitinophaga horti]UYQ95719.1 cytochrome c [Chitinophaga horti]
MTKYLFLIAFLLSAKAQAYEGPAKVLYSKHCATCHGDAGDRGRFGARNLKASSLSDSSIIRQISKGKGIMPAFARRLKPEEMTQLADYIKTLRTR